MKPACVSLTLFLFLLAVPLVAQQAVVPELEKCTVEGLVVKAATSEPLNKARLVLRKAEGRAQPYSAVTEANGRFTLKDIEPGRYRLWVARNGYVAQEYGQREPNRPGTILTLAPGQHLRDIVFRLIPAAVITGRVYDEDGEPVPGAMVQVLRYGYIRGQRQLQPSGRVASNDLGEYRVYGLAPGRYYVSATYTPGLLWISGGIAEARLPGQFVSEEGYVPTYYPGTNAPGDATPLELRPGDELRGIDFTLIATRTVRLRGRVFNAITGRPGRGTQLRLLPRKFGLSGLAPSSRPVQDADGSFEITGVAAGSYVLSAMWFHEGKQYSARLPLEVGSTDIDGINLVVGPGVDLPGRVRVEGAAQPTTPPAVAQQAQRPAEGKPEGQVEFTEFSVWLQPSDETPLGGGRASVRADGTFVLENVAHDIYRVTLRGAPADFYLKAARLGGQDVLEADVDLSAGAPSGTLELVLSPAGGRIEGSVLDEEQQAFSGAQVVLVPEPRRRSQADLYKSTTTDQYGRFTLRGISPGDYKLFAWEEVERGAYQDADFLRPYEERGEPVRVEEGSRLSVQLELIPAGERPR